GDKIEGDEKQAIETAKTALEEAIKGEDADDIKAKTEALSAASHKFAERIYAAQAEAAQAGGAQADAGSGSGGQQGGGSNGSAKNDGADNVVDAEFEVKN